MHPDGLFRQSAIKLQHSQHGEKKKNYGFELTIYLQAGLPQMHCNWAQCGLTL